MDLRAPVGAHPFLAEMKPHHLDLLAGCASIKQFEGGEMIFRAGQPATGFYLIENGSVAIEGSVFEHGTITTDTLTAGEPLGWSWMFPPYVWHFSARATEPTTAIFFYGTILREYCEHDSSLGYELFKRITPITLKRLQAARRKMLSVHAHGAALEPAVLESPFL